MGIVNRISEAEQERVGLFSEEMGEAQQAIGKILRHGIDSHHPDSPELSNANLLELEAGHVLAAIDLLVACGTLSQEVLEQARLRKLQKLRSWLHAGTNLDAVDELLRLNKQPASTRQFAGPPSRFPDHVDKEGKGYYLFRCGKCKAVHRFEASALRGGWPVSESPCCGSGAWTSR